MNKEAVVYHQESCFACAKVIDALLSAGVTVEVREVADLLSGKFRDIEALAQLGLQNQELPVVLIEGKAVNPQEVMSWT